MPRARSTSAPNSRCKTVIKKRPLTLCGHPLYRHRDVKNASPAAGTLTAKECRSKPVLRAKRGKGGACPCPDFT